MHNILITGGTGLLGANLIDQLLEQSYSVKVIVRKPSQIPTTKKDKLKYIVANLFDDFTKHLHQIDIVVHIAAITDQNLPNYADYWKINCNATMQLLHSGVKCHVKQFVFISTANTIHTKQFQTKKIENALHTSLSLPSLYAKSKWEAEQYLLKHKDKIAIKIIHPTFMIGAKDSKPSSGKIILMGWRKKWVFYPPGGKNFVHVKDVCEGIIKSFSSGKSGERYLLANENLSYREFYEKLNAITKQSPTMVRIPKSFLQLLGGLGDFLQKIGVKSSLSSNNMRLLCSDNYYSNQKSAQELQLSYRSTDEAITDAINYFSR